MLPDTSGEGHMTSILAWLDHDTKARERTLRILNLFQERESRDELGLGVIRDSFTDQLFPGTSTIQTRLRYMLFVPWMYRDLERKNVPAKDFARQAEEHEKALIVVLKAARQTGIIGKLAGSALKRLPASIYWNGLGVWGIRLTRLSQEEYHQRIDALLAQRRALADRARAARERGDDADAVRDQAATWHPCLPAPPPDFPKVASFALTGEEAAFLRDRIRESCPHSLLAHLAEKVHDIDVAAPWELSGYGDFPVQHKELLHHARLFSELMHGAALLYNVQLAELSGARTLEEHRQALMTWGKALPLHELRHWSLERLRELVDSPGHRVSPHTHDFVRKWRSLVLDAKQADLLDNKAARELIRQRECFVKRGQSRFANRRALEQWRGRSGTGRLRYRWATARDLLNDLYQGLDSRGKHAGS